MRTPRFPIGLLFLCLGALAGGCSSTPLTTGGATGGTGGQEPAGDSPGGRSGDGGSACGAAVCGAGDYCCNAGCSICAPIGSACVAGCSGPVDGGPIVTPVDGGPVSDGGSVCDDLRAEYNAALPGAGDCTPGAPDQCSQMVRTVLGVPLACDPNCMQMYVNDATALTALATAYEQSCPSAATCLLIACEPPPQATCQPTGDGGSGHCAIPPI